MRRTRPLEPEDVKIGRSNTGLGLFARLPLMPGRYLEYTGKMIPTAAANRRKRARYLFEVNRQWTIDGSPRTNLARYLNHACDPNCESRESEGRIFIVVTKLICPGEELTFDYGEEYVQQFIAPHGCRCSLHRRTPHPPTGRRIA